MARAYTSGEWFVRTGEEEAFASTWRKLAEWASTLAGASGSPVLLRDRDDPRRFVSFGPWDNLEAINEFRSSPEFAEFMGRLRPLLEDSRFRTLETAIEF